MGTFLQKTKIDSSNSYNNSSSASTIMIPTHTPPFHCPGTRFKSGWRLPCFILNYPSTMVHYEIQQLYHRLLWRSAAQALGHMHGVRSSSNQIQALLTSKFADSKNVQFIICILSRPTLLITVTETDLKAQEVYGRRQKRWKSKVKSLESNHPPFSRFYFDKSAY